MKPLEASYLKIPLEVISEERGLPKAPAESPLIVYIAKNTKILDDISSLNSAKKPANLDLKVFISRDEDCPNDKNFDLKFDFTDCDNIFQICKILIYPANSKYKFNAKEENLNIGLYSLQGLSDVALIYGFGYKNELNLRKQLILHYNKNPNALQPKPAAGPGPVVSVAGNALLNDI